MGEVADAMLDGTLCAGCGAYIGADDGFARYCSSACETDHAYQPAGLAPPPVKRDRDMAQCPVCNRWVKYTGLAKHTAAKHGDPVPL